MKFGKYGLKLLLQENGLKVSTLSENKKKTVLVKITILLIIPQFKFLSYGIILYIYTKISKFKNTQGQSGFVLTLPELIIQTGIYRRDREKLLISH